MQAFQVGPGNELAAHVKKEAEWRRGGEL